MPLPTGTRVGSFVIQRAIGAGGMGEVYLAEDARLRRRVALKVLAPHLATDESAGKRLLREARTAAALEHPNICAVYEVGEADGHGFVAMQYVEGQNLAERLQLAPIELRDAISIAAQIANALAEAHGRGIVHRDVKPQNVMISSTNHVTVLDFGLAKATAPAAVTEQTATGLTRAGVVSGTWLYMSPEQARGDVVDERSDVFSFGVLLYELVTRTHPFAQDSWADSLAAMLAADPRPVATPLPPELRRILRKCLEKDRARRYQTARDVAIDLETLAQELSPARAGTLSRPAVPAAPPGRTDTMRRMGIAIITTVAAAAAAIVWWNGRTSTPVPSAYEAITDFTDSAMAPALSADGRMVTFIRGGSWFLTKTGQIYVKMLPNGEALKLTDDPRDKFGPVFSADGSRVAYTALTPSAEGFSWDTWTVPISGGTPTRLLGNAAGLSWIDSRHVLFSEIQPNTPVHMALMTATEDRRDARRIYLPAHERGMAHFSALSPDRAWVLIVEMGPSSNFERCRLVPFDGSSEGRLVGPEGACQSAAWSPDQRWMYFAARVSGLSHLWRQRFPDGTPEPLTSSPVAEEEGVAIAPDGRSLVTSIGIRQSSLWLHSRGSERLLSSEGYARDPTLSPDGTRLYYLLRRASAPGIVELRAMDLATQRSDRLLPDFSIVDYAVSRDEQEVAITASAADGSPAIWVAALDRRTAPRRVVERGDNVAFGAKRDLVFRSSEGHANFVTRIGLDGRNRTRVSDISAVDIMATSPDGQWVTFSGRLDNDRIGIIAAAVYGGESKVLCYALCTPAWSPDGALLYLSMGFEAPRPTLIVPLEPGQPFPAFPGGTTDALTAWRKLPNARLVERPTSIPGLDESTYVVTKSDDRRNLFRVPLPR